MCINKYSDKLCSLLSHFMRGERVSLQKHMFSFVFYIYLVYGTMQAIFYFINVDQQNFFHLKYFLFRIAVVSIFYTWVIQHFLTSLLSAHFKSWMFANSFLKNYKV